MLDDLECRMYLLPESSAAAREWESKFNYVASIFNEVRGWDENSGASSSINSSRSDDYSYQSSDEEEEEEEEEDDDDDDSSFSNNLTVPLKLMW